MFSSVVHRYISNRVAKRTTPPFLEEVEAKIERLAWDMKDDVFDALSTNEFLVQDRRKGLKGANKAAREYMKPYEENGSIVPIVSGKSLLSKLSSWSQSEFSVSINAISLIREFCKSEIPKEIERVITTIEHLQNF